MGKHSDERQEGSEHAGDLFKLEKDLVEEAEAEALDGGDFGGRQRRLEDDAAALFQHPQRHRAHHVVRLDRPCATIY